MTRSAPEGRADLRAPALRPDGSERTLTSQRRCALKLQSDMFAGASLAGLWGEGSKKARCGESGRGAINRASLELEPPRRHLSFTAVHPQRRLQLQRPSAAPRRQSGGRTPDTRHA